MAIDERWSVREARGFTWWGHRLAQRVWAEPARESHGASVVRIHAETAVLRKVLRGPGTSQKIGILNRWPSLSAFVWDPDHKRVTLRCAMTVHRENIGWAKSLFVAAAGIQAADAHIKLTQLSPRGLYGDAADYGEVGKRIFEKAEAARRRIAAAKGGWPMVWADLSHHPRSGAREEPDGMLDIIRDFFVPQGQGPSPFTEDDFKTALAMKPAPWVQASGGGPELTAELAFTGSRPAAMLDAGQEGPPRNGHVHGLGEGTTSAARGRCLAPARSTAQTETKSSSGDRRALELGGGNARPRVPVPRCMVPRPDARRAFRHVPARRHP